jgi:hypothetical protein
VRNPINLAEVQADVLYPPSEAAKIRGKSTKTLANERSERRGPAVTYVGKAPYYRGADLLEDIARGRVDFQTPLPRSAPRRRRGAT